MLGGGTNCGWGRWGDKLWVKEVGGQIVKWGGGVGGKTNCNERAEGGILRVGGNCKEGGLGRGGGDGIEILRVGGNCKKGEANCMGGAR
jgi:hypothetical protein